MNLYFQILTHTQTVRGLNLLEFLSIFVRSKHVEGSATVSAGGTISRFRFNSSRQLIAKASMKSINQFEIKCNAQLFDFGSTASVKSVIGVFTPSASSEMWFSSSNWQAGGDRLVRTRKMNAKAKETALRTYAVKKPNLLEVVFEIEPMVSKHALLQSISRGLAANAPEPFLQTNPFGCCDVGGNELFVKMETGVIMTENIRVMAELWPSGYPLLGSRFDKLHPVMFGNATLCRNIASTLGGNAELVCDAAQQSWAVIYINPTCNFEETNKMASEWLLLQKSAH